MTMTVGAYEAKTHFAGLLDRVARGETITVTRHGMPVAQLGPVVHDKTREAHQAVEGLRELRQCMSLGGLSVKDLVNEGRR